MKISVLAALAFLPLTANAGILFDNGIYNLLGGNEMGDALMAEDFNLGATSDLTAIRYWTLEAPGAYLGSITWGIYADGGGQPGSFLAGGNTGVTTTPTPDSVDGFNIFQNDFNINVANLLAGTYWLVLHDGLATDVNFQDYYWAYTDAGVGQNAGTSVGLNLDLPGGTTWNSTDNEHAFQVSGNASGAPGVPEPSTLVLFGAGLVGVIAGRIKTRRGGRQ